MSDYGGAEWEFDEDDNVWEYVEVAYDAADELAEYTCPSPPEFAGEVDNVQEYDMFEYFADLAYLSDGGYFDNQDPDAKKSRKRKLAPSAPKIHKRQKTSAPNPHICEPVVWMTAAERHSLDQPVSTVGSCKVVALLKDWRTRFENHKGLATFPEGDFQLEDDNHDDEEYEDEDDVSRDYTIDGEAFDLSDMQKVAALIGGQDMEHLQKIMEAQGLDPDVVKEVIRDMMEGKQREFNEGEEDVDGDEELDEQEGGPDAAAFGDTHVYAAPVAASVATDSARRGAGSGTASTPVPNGRAAHGKRKDRDAEEAGDGRDDFVVSSAKRPRTVPAVGAASTLLPARNGGLNGSPGRRSRGRRS